MIKTSHVPPEYSRSLVTSTPYLNNHMVMNWSTVIQYRNELGLKPFLFCSNLLLLSDKGGFPGGSNSKVSACNERDLGSVPRPERSPGEENDNTLWYSCLENFMDRGAWQVIYSP